MAKPVCTYCGDFEAILLMTNMDDGDTQAICPSDVPMFILSMAGQVTEGMTPEQSEQFGALFDQIKANDARTPAPAARKRAAKSAPPADPPPPTAAPEAATAARVELPEPCPLCGSQTATGDAEKLTCDGCGTVLATADDAA